MGKLSDKEGKDLCESQRSLKVMSGRGGARVLGGTTVRTGLHIDSICIREDDTTFTTLVCTNSGTSTVVLDDTFFLGGAPGFKAGDPLTPPEGWRFTDITLATGSIAVTGPNIGT